MLVDRLQMLLPHCVPSEALVGGMPVESRASEVAALLAPPGGLASNSEIADRIDRLLQKIPAATECRKEFEIPVEDSAHDAFFHVQRVEGDSPAIFVRMAFSARLILLREVEEAPVSIARSQLEFMDRALADLAASLTGQPNAADSYVKRWETRGQAPRVMVRWVRGHQIFAALTQGLLHSLGAMGRAVRSGKFDEVRRWADLSISLLRGSGACFVLTGDFTVEAYTTHVRPSMMPPAVPFCLSGLMSSDHRQLVQMLRDLKPAFKSLQDHDKSRYDQIHEELKTVYDQHIHVCERFVGERPSLLTAGRTEKSGPALIEQFKTLRLKSFETPAHASRLTPDASPRPGARCPVPHQPAHSPDLGTNY